MPNIREVVDYLSSFAPQLYQENYDNTGLLTGNPEAETKGILTTLDATEPIVDEAIESNCNLIVAHHPLIFKPLRKLTGSNYVERTVEKAIKHDIAIYAAHTNLDNISTGVNAKIAEKLGLQDLQILAPKSGTLKKLTFFVPPDYTQQVTQALHKAGAGNTGNYTECSFRSTGTGAFKPGNNTQPFLGEKNKLEEVKENRVEVLVPADKASTVLNAMHTHHPYEEVAYYLQPLENQNQEIGSGMTGFLPEPQLPKDFLQYLKTCMQLSIIRHTPLPQTRIEKIALCGGAGSFLLKDAIQNNADVFISGDFKYHEFFDADGKIMIADIGHYESEMFTKALLKDTLTKKFNELNIKLSNINTNPITYA